jgi:phosphatidylinositol glycan class P protein
VPTYEYYGFILYLMSSLTFVVYLLWAYLPSPFLHQLGIYYYPNRWWALAIPAWAVMFVLYIYVALASYNTGYLTLPMSSVACLVDEAASVATINAQGKIVRDERPSWRTQSPDGKAGRAKSTVGAKSAVRKGRPGIHSRQPSATKMENLDWRTLWNEGTDAVMDIPIGGVCEILYGQVDEDLNGVAHG